MSIIWSCRLASTVVNQVLTWLLKELSVELWHAVEGAVSCAEHRLQSIRCMHRCLCCSISKYHKQRLQCHLGIDVGLYLHHWTALVGPSSCSGSHTWPKLPVLPRLTALHLLLCCLSQTPGSVAVCEAAARAEQPPSLDIPKTQPTVRAYEQGALTKQSKEQIQVSTNNNSLSSLLALSEDSTEYGVSLFG